jgi:hypothetical protein
VRFAPTGFVSSAGEITINSDDPLQPLRPLTVTGTGNSLPPLPQLLAPANNASGLVSPVTFSWTQGGDPDGDALTQTLLIDTDPHFVDAAAIIVFAASTTGVLVATTGFFLWPRAGRRRWLLLFAGLLVVFGLMAACGGGGGGGARPVPTDSIVVTNLSPATTYYWKVHTVDSHGGVSESEVWSFSTR